MNSVIPDIYRSSLWRCCWYITVAVRAKHKCQPRCYCKQHIQHVDQMSCVYRTVGITIKKIPQKTHWADTTVTQQFIWWTQVGKVPFWGKYLRQMFYSGLKFNIPIVKMWYCMSTREASLNWPVEKNMQLFYRTFILC